MLRKVGKIPKVDPEPFPPYSSIKMISSPRVRQHIEQQVDVLHSSKVRHYYICMSVTSPSAMPIYMHIGIFAPFASA